MTFDMMINTLAVIGAGTCVYWLFRILSRFLHWVQTSAPEAASNAVAPADIAPDSLALNDRTKNDIAVIAAAVAAMGSSHRIVHISDVHSGVHWTADGRWMHQTSHQPR